MWDLIVSVPDHWLSFCFAKVWRFQYGFQLVRFDEWYIKMCIFWFLRIDEFLQYVGIAITEGCYISLSLTFAKYKFISSIFFEDCLSALGQTVELRAAYLLEIIQLCL